MVVVGEQNLQEFLPTGQGLTESTIGRVFLSKVSSDPQKTFLKYKKYGSFRNISRIETLNSMKALYSVLTDLGLQKGDRVVFLSENRQQLITSILSVVSGGMVAVPLHSDFTHLQIDEVIKNSRPKCIIISDDNQLDKLERIENFENIPIITFEHVSNDLIYYKELVKKHKNCETGYEADIINVWPDDLACIIYSSDEDGKLIGSKLTHKNIISSIGQLFEDITDINENDISLSYLPVSLGFGGIQELYSILFSGGVYSVAGEAKISTLIENIREVGATVLFSVPRVLEKIYEKFALKQENPEELFVISTGGSLKTVFCAGASLDNSVIEFYTGLGINVRLFYGHTETSGAVAVKTYKPGSVNIDQKSWKIMNNTQTRISSDGEILIRGDIVSSGYFNYFSEDSGYTINGWFKTGDLGVITESGDLRVLNKKKDIITLSTGHKISPQKIENMIKSEFVHQAVVIGEGRKFLSALIVPDFKYLREYTLKELKITYSSFEELLQNKWIRALYKLILENANDELPSYEAIKGYALLTQPFSVDSMELTPTGKPIRNIVQVKRKSEIESIYRIHAKRFI